jgi:uncharacterized lipoprotein YddW (UPF0748 family)
MTSQIQAARARPRPRFAVAAAILLLAVACARPPIRSRRVVYDEQSLRDRALRTAEGRAVWVTRWDYKTADDVRRIVDNCARAGFNIIVFQVRGNATAFYRSSIEPWAWELTSTGPATTGRDPGFDPLALAVERAHRRGVELHAYMNVFPGWMSQKYPPAEVGQVWTKHPEWFVADREGRKMIPWDRDLSPQKRNYYSWLNPAHPDVKDYVVSVFREVAERYDVDGIHLDYCRYPDVGDYSYDPVSLSRFREATGKTPDEAPDLWTKWRGDQVTEVVQRIHDECRKIKPDLMISASVMRDPTRAPERLMQRPLDWMAAGKIEAAFPMIYTTDNAIVAQSVTEYVGNGSGRLVVAGLKVPGNDPKVLTDRPSADNPGAPKNVRAMIEQIGVARLAGAQGVSLFSYGVLFPKHKPNNLAKAFRDGPFRQPARVPLPPRELPPRVGQVGNLSEGPT